MCCVCVSLYMIWILDKDKCLVSVNIYSMCQCVNSVCVNTLGQESYF